jgi:hypothetical protein
MHGLSESEAKGWQAVDFREDNTIPKVEMQHVIVILPRNVIHDVASETRI